LRDDFLYIHLLIFQTLAYDQHERDYDAEAVSAQRTVIISVNEEMQHPAAKTAVPG
jgi:hypothetical protein